MKGSRIQGFKDSSKMLKNYKELNTWILSLNELGEELKIKAVKNGRRYGKKDINHRR
jgi:hypothetical protein